MQLPPHIQTLKHNSAVNQITISEILQVNPTKIIDFGAGDGFYGKLMKFLLPECHRTGVEVNGDYVEKFGLTPCYDELIISNLVDVLDKLTPDNDYDLAIFGDVLEHLSEDVSKECIKKANELFPYIIINSPVGLQLYDHPIEWERHKCGITEDWFSDYEVEHWDIYDGGIMFNCLIKGQNV